MTITVHSTTKIVTLDGMQCRVWEGETERGVQIHCYIPRIAVARDQDQSQFEAELQEQRAPSVAIAALPLHLLL